MSTMRDERATNAMLARQKKKEKPTECEYLS